MSTSEQHNSLYGKHILFIGQVFYDYHLKIIDQLETFGGRVVFFENKIFKDKAASIHTVGSFINPCHAKRKEAYVDDILAKTSSEKFDYLFCVGGFSITAKLVKSIRVQSPNVKCVLYLWDSLKIWEYTNVIGFFDKAFSFDREDCSTVKNLEYLPLFYTDEYANTNYTPTDIDVLYVGSVGAISLDRYYILKQFSEAAVEQGINTYFHLYFSPTRGLKKAINSIRMLFASNSHYLNVLNAAKDETGSFVKSTTLTRDEIAGLLSRSKCVLDIPVKNQYGMTIRSIETLAVGKKLITTNTHVVKEDFYDADVISLLKSNKPIDVSFIEAKPKKLDLNYLLISNWLTTIFR